MRTQTPAQTDDTDSSSQHAILLIYKVSLRRLVPSTRFASLQGEPTRLIAWLYVPARLPFDSPMASVSSQNM